MTSVLHDSSIQIDAPLEEFSKCHHQFVSQLHAALYLPELVESASRARMMATDLLEMFQHGLLVHHEDEERELFPAVQHAAKPGEERELVDRMVAQLVQEHEAVKALWKRIEPSVSSVAAGHTPAVDAVLLEAIVQHFFAHVHFEEHDFLPLAQKILSRHSSEMAALGMALHTRHGHHEQEG
jgi:iron-sulfur cluster repair protein YtfE (RIC family)